MKHAVWASAANAMKMGTVVKDPLTLAATVFSAFSASKKPKELQTTSGTFLTPVEVSTKYVSELNVTFTGLRTKGTEQFHGHRYYSS